MMCPEDWQGLAPERDRPAADEFDWAPEALNLSEAALNVLWFYDHKHPGYVGAIKVWQSLCGMDEASSLTFALQIADAVPPVMGTIPPF